MGFGWQAVDKSVDIFHRWIRKVLEMSFEDIFSNICRNLGDAKSISKRFSESKNDEDRFKLTYDICGGFISKLNFKRVNKSYTKSSSLAESGDTHFSNATYWDAVKSYNESIAFAPPGSEQLALNFFKRSLALTKLSFINEATSDCSSALHLVKSDNLKNEIENFKKVLRESENLESSCLIGSGIILPLYMDKSTFFESAAKSVGFLCDEKWGRQLIATENIETGKVLIVEKPYSSVLLPTHLYTHCSHCYKRSLNLKPCNGCSFAMFCSGDCQKRSWDAYHEVECKMLDILIGLKFERMELLSLRALIIATQQGRNLQNLYEEININECVKNNNNEENYYKSFDFKNIYNLVTNSEKRTVSDLFHRSVASVILIYLLEKCTDFFNLIEKGKKELFKVFCGGLILRFKQSFPCNAHEISEFCEEGLVEIGAGAYATLSLINHSCDPNVVRYSCGDIIVLRVIKPIKKGEQILDNYGYHYAAQSLPERQAALLKQYYFKCECEACAHVWPTYEDLPSEDLKLKKQINIDIYKKKTEQFEENLTEIFSGNFNSEIIEENMKYLDFLDEFVERPWKNYNKCQEAIKYCLSFSGNHFRFSKQLSC